MATKRPLRRPGRFRRWVLRPLLWALAGLAVLIFVLQLLVDTQRTRDWARDLLADHLSAALERQVNIADISFELLPLSVELWGLTLAGATPADPPFLEIPWLSIDADLSALERRRLRLSLVRLERPRVLLEYFADGGDNLLRPRRGGDRKPRLEIFIDRLEIDRAEFELERQRLNLSVSADAVRARLRGLGELHLEGQLIAQNAKVRLPGAKAQIFAVAAEGAIDRHGLEVTAARISGPELEARVKGSCVWSRGDPSGRKCLFLARGQTSGAQLAELDYFTDLTGDFTFDGSLGWRPGAFGWRSNIAAPQLEIWDRRLEDIAGVLAADRYGVRLALERARYNGGHLSGSIGCDVPAEGRPITVELTFADIEIDRLLRDQLIPAAGFASRLDGQVSYTFPLRAARAGQGHGSVELKPDADMVGLALAGTTPLRIDAGRIQAQPIQLRSPRQSALAEGWYDLRQKRGQFQYDIATADVKELIDLLIVVQTATEPAPWLPETGQGEVRGTLHLLPTTTESELSLRLEGVTAATLATPQRLAGSLRVTPRELDQLRLELTGDGALLLRGRVPLLADDSDEISLSIDALDWQLAAVEPWVPWPLPIDGRISGHLDLNAGKEHTRGQLRATATPVTAHWGSGVDLESLTTRLAWDGDWIRIDDLTARSPAGAIAAFGTADFATGDLDLQLRSSSLELAQEPLRTFSPRQDVSGTIEVSGRLGGRLGDPRLELTATADQLRIGDRELPGDPSRLHLEWLDGRLDLRGRLLDMVSIDGGGVLDRTSCGLAFQVAGDDLGDVLELLGSAPPDDLEGSFSGRLRLAGVFAAGDPQTTLELDELRVSLRERTLANARPVILELTRDKLSMHALELAEENTASRLSLAGDIGYGNSSAITVDLVGDLPLDWLELLDPSFVETTGRVALTTRILGTLDDPWLEGHGEISAGSWRSPSFPYDLDRLEARVLLSREAVVVERLAAGFAGGEIEASGRISGFAPLDYSFQLAARDLELRYPEGWSLRGSADLALESADNGAAVRGNAVLDRAEFLDDVPLGFEQIVQGFLERQRLEVDEATGLMATTTLHVLVSAPATVRVQNNLADLQGSAEMTLRGSLARPLLFGDFEIAAGGRLAYNSTDYEIERGRLSFANPYRIDPEIDLVASTRVRELEVTLDLSGTADRLEARFSSEPPLPDLEVFRLLATGGGEETEEIAVRRIAELGEEQSTSAASFLYGQAAAVIGNRVKGLFGFDRFRIDPLTGSGDNLSTARFTVGKRLSKDLFVTYSVDPSSSEDQRLQVEWQMNQDLALLLTQNGDGSYSADARWETSF